MAHLTRRGALAVTTDMDRLADLMQRHYASLGISEKVAMDAALRLDMLSDHVEKYAIKLAEEDGEEAPAEEVEEEVEVKKEARSHRKAEDEDEDEALLAEMVEEEKKTASRKLAVDETGTSVEPDGNGFDANEIGDEVPGPLENGTPDESWMAKHFTQERFQQLRGKQQGGDIGFFVSAKTAEEDEALLAEMEEEEAKKSASKKSDEEDESEDEALLAEMVEEAHKAASKKSSGYNLFQ